jgi:phosphoribosylformylglycinamidine cyclo-ligase
MSEKYKSAGVDVSKGYLAVDRIKKHAKMTHRAGVMGQIGAFAGLFDFSDFKYEEPVFVSGTDGVGTKLLLAIEFDKHDTIGIDLVAMCVNDIVAMGAKPLFFLDYIAVDSLNPLKIETIIKGICEGLKIAECALIGGETAEMPDMYAKGHYDLAGFAVGVVEKSKIIDGSRIKESDVIIGLPSSGLHSNGYSLVRKILFKDNDVKIDESLLDQLLKPTRIYVKAILGLMKEVDILGISHITGGGFYENIPRIIPNNLGVEIFKDSFEVTEVFKLIQNLGNIEHQEMFEVFNMGIGMMVVVREDNAKKAIEILNEFGEEARLIGRVSNEVGVKLK